MQSDTFSSDLAPNQKDQNCKDAESGRDEGSPCPLAHIGQADMGREATAMPMSADNFTRFMVCLNPAIPGDHCCCDGDQEQNKAGSVDVSQARSVADVLTLVCCGTWRCVGPDDRRMFWMVGNCRCCVDCGLMHETLDCFQQCRAAQICGKRNGRVTLRFNGLQQA